MLIIISPAKTFKVLEADYIKNYEPLEMAMQTDQLVEILKGYEIDELCQLMKMSEELGKVNKARYEQFNGTSALGYEAIRLFHGEAYKGIDIETLDAGSIDFLEEHLIILSGLYGMIRPRDYIQPYRLEMGTKLVTPEGKNLYEFWKEHLTKKVIERLGQSKGDKVLLNLASDEYSKVLQLKKIEKSYPVITISFKEAKDGQYRVVGMYAKKARGKMVRFLSEQKMSTVEEIKGFKEDGYQFNEALSDEKHFVFTR